MRRENACPPLVIAVCLWLAGVDWADPSVIYVDGAVTGANDGSSWTDAYVLLQDALAAARGLDGPGEIRVAGGTYVCGAHDSFELLDDVTLKGGYAGRTGGDPNARDPARSYTVLRADSGAEQVVTGSRTDTTAVLDGFAIIPGARTTGLLVRDGSPTLIDCRFTQSNGRPAFDASNCRSVLVGCHFEDNEDEAIHLWSGHLILRECTFLGNSGSYVILSHGALDLQDCSFIGNSGKVSCSETLFARACVFRGNVCYGETVSCGHLGTFLDCGFFNNEAQHFGPGALQISGDVATVSRCVFAGNAAGTPGGLGGGAIESHAAVLTLSHCVFAGNSGDAFGAGAIVSAGKFLRITHCTFSGNRGRPNTLLYGMRSGARVEMARSIVCDGAQPFARMFYPETQLTVTYSNVQGSYPGLGNIAVDPCFVAPGCWEPNGTPDDAHDDSYGVGDYHLKSQAGHWDAETKSWIRDGVTSLCIDAGDPNVALGLEPFPNGGYVNLGAYGGTAEASRSYFGAPVCATPIAGDINGDCRVDDLDLDILMSHWLMPDIGKTNIPPTVRILGLSDGVALAEPTPIVLRADAFDSDGTVVQVSYVLKHDYGDGCVQMRSPVWDSDDGWSGRFGWPDLRYDGLYTVWAEAVDDDGAIGVSPSIMVTLQRANQK